MIDAPPAAVAFWEVPQRLVRLPDGRRLNLYCTGKGTPTVILESGFSATTWSWANVQPRIARTNRVCSYDRAGLGFSDPGPMPRDGRAVVADLRALLRVAKLAPPYILVGHSAGGMTMRLFADPRFSNVAGLVLLDPSVEGQFAGQEAAVAARVAADERCAVLAEKRQLPSADPRDARCTKAPAGVSPSFGQVLMAAQRNPAYWRTLASEYASIAGANSDALRATRTSHGDLPLVVLTAGQTAAAAPGWEAAHRELAARSTRGVQRTLAGASHNIMKDAPDAVASAVAEVTAEAKRPAAPSP
ncbi:alpha/beta fold hydrolase [Glacieibacterium frigidum]|uniref:alpha/beta fold hydrolase n=1 Tax=Glacieibacterium frigidum TaxID=2593303 RepID=UPI00163DA600|nr:alpha/beta hydrolase [Glacieibacterium frigidum]